MTTEPEVLLKETKHVGIIILNRPKALNSINNAINIGLSNALKKFEKEKSLVIIKGEGRAFCAGGDIINLNKMTRDSDRTALIDFSTMLDESFYIIHTYRIPIITLVNGIAFGGGAGITAFSKYAIVTEKALFSMPEVKFGFHTNAGASYFLNRSQGELGKYMSLTGHSLKGADIVNAGYATHFCLSKNFQKLEEDLTNCTNANDVQRVVKDNCEKSLPAFSLGPFMDRINLYFSQPTIEEIILKLESDQSEWAKKIVGEMEKYAPAALKVTFRQLKVTKNMDLLDCLIIEMNLTNNFYKFDDAAEGVKALLVDKKHVPKWNPATLSEVTEKVIQDHFAESGGQLLKQILLKRQQELANDLKKKL